MGREREVQEQATKEKGNEPEKIPLWKSWEQFQAEESFICDPTEYSFLTWESVSPLPMVYQIFLTSSNILWLCQLFQEALVVLLITGKLSCPLTTFQH